MPKSNTSRSQKQLRIKGLIGEIPSIKLAHYGIDDEKTFLEAMQGDVDELSRISTIPVKKLIRIQTLLLQSQPLTVNNDRDQSITDLVIEDHSWYHIMVGLPFRDKATSQLSLRPTIIYELCGDAHTQFHFECEWICRPQQYYQQIVIGNRIQSNHTFKTKPCKQLFTPQLVMMCNPGELDDLTIRVKPDDWNAIETPSALVSMLRETNTIRELFWPRSSFGQGFTALITVPQTTQYVESTSRRNSMT